MDGLYSKKYKQNFSSYEYTPKAYVKNNSTEFWHSVDLNAKFGTNATFEHMEVVTTKGSKLIFLSDSQGFFTMYKKDL